MGAAASSLPDEIDFNTFQALVTDASPDLFRNYCNDHDKIPRDMFLKLASRADVFLSHDWGTDSNGRDNHARVRMIKEKLAAKKIVCWFDEDQMTGDIDDKMARGIDNSSCVIAFITKRYMEKVASDNMLDNCRKEFKYAARKKGEEYMIPVVMEPEVKNTRDWIGPVSFTLGGVLYCDCSSDSDIDAAVERLYVEILKRTTLIKAPKSFGTKAAISASEPAQHHSTEVAPPPPVPHHADVAFHVPRHLYLFHLSAGGDIYMASKSAQGHTLTQTVHCVDGLWSSSGALCYFHGKLYMAFAGRGHQLYIAVANNEGRFSSTAVFAIGTHYATSVTLASFKGKLYISFVGREGKIYQGSSSDGTDFSIEEISGWKGSCVSLAALRDKLFLAHIGGGGAVYMASTSDGHFASNSASNISGWRASDLDMATFKDKLYMVHIGGGGAVYMASTTSGEFHPHSASAVAGWRASDVCLAAHDDQLHMVHVGGGNKLYYASTNTGEFNPNGASCISDGWWASTTAMAGHCE